MDQRLVIHRLLILPERTRASSLAFSLFAASFEDTLSSLDKLFVCSWCCNLEKKKRKKKKKEKRLP